MKYLDKINKLADSFEYKLRKLAEGVADTGMVSSYVGGVVEPLLNESSATGGAWSKALQAAVQKAVNSAWEKEIELHGSVHIGLKDSYMLNANLVNGKWVVNKATSGVKLGGTLSDNPYILAATKTFLPSINATINNAVEKQLNLAAGQLKGDTISQETMISSGLQAQV